MVHGDLNFLKTKYKNLNNLTILCLREHKLTSLDPTIFNGLMNLNELSLKQNLLTSIDSNIFNGLNNLKRLDLRRNQLSSLDAKLFSGLDKLNKLELSGNKLTSLDENILNGLNNLNELDLDNNQLTSLSPNIFDNLNNLNTLLLSLNQLSSLDANIFNHLKKLNKLSLSGNQLSSLNANIFDNLKNLNTLLLSLNQLSSLDAKIFNNLKLLRKLDLSDNQLTSFDSNIFGRLNNLSHLSLGRNQLTSLDAKIFNSLDKLCLIRLHDNKLTTLDANIFKGLKNLTELSLSGNRLTSLDPNIFNDLKKLSKLSLSGNQLTSLDANIFKGLSDLRKLYLHDNQLTNLNHMRFSHFGRMTVISLYDNKTDFVSFYDNAVPVEYVFNKDKKSFNNFKQFLDQFKDDSLSNSQSESTFLGKIFGNYYIEKRLGSGAYAKVYSCLDLIDQSRKAVKIYGIENSQYIEDINKLKQIDSENVIKYYTLFQQHYLHLVVFEFAENGDLDTLIENHRKNDRNIDPSKIFHWTVQATQGLQMLHENKIIHRDIKPANIFLSKDDKIKLGDLGIAKIIEENEIASGKFTFMGTHLYMSPEIIKSQAFSFNTDIWSLGCVVYELLFLKRAFPVFSFERIVETLDFKDSILTGITKKMLTVDRENRPTSNELYQHLMKLKKILLENDDD